jgi:hypothetical protein
MEYYTNVSKNGGKISAFSVDWQVGYKTSKQCKGCVKQLVFLQASNKNDSISRTCYIPVPTDPPLLGQHDPIIKGFLLGLEISFFQASISK